MKKLVCALSVHSLCAVLREKRFRTPFQQRKFRQVGGAFKQHFCRCRGIRQQLTVIVQVGGFKGGKSALAAAEKVSCASELQVLLGNGKSVRGEGD